MPGSIQGHYAELKKLPGCAITPSGSLRQHQYPQDWMGGAAGAPCRAELGPPTFPAISPGAEAGCGEHGQAAGEYARFIYIQRSSPWPAPALDPEPSESIQDLMRPPGSRTTKISAMMEGRCLVIANEPSSGPGCKNEGIAAHSTFIGSSTMREAMRSRPICTGIKSGASPMSSSSWSSPWSGL